jgi:hypothetical protein
LEDLDNREAAIEQTQRDLAKLLASIYAQNAHPSKEELQSTVKQAPTLFAALTAKLNADPNFPSSLDATTREQYRTCIKAITGLDTNAQPNSNAGKTFSLPQEPGKPACSEDVMRRVSAELSKAGDEAANDWNDCRKTIAQKAPQYIDLVPIHSVDASDADLATLKEIAAKPDVATKSPEVTKCADTLPAVKAKQADASSAKSSWGEALGAAAAFCYYTGCDPLGCALAFGLATVVCILEGCDGGGGGGGAADGKGGKGVAAQKPEGSASHDAREKNALEAVRGSGIKGNRDTNNGGHMHCDGHGAVLNCWIDNVAGSGQSFYGDSVITTDITSGSSDTLSVCPGNKAGVEFIKGIVIKSGGGFYVFGASPQGGTKSPAASFAAGCSILQ